MKEILKDLVESITLPEDGYLEQDQEILEIFVEEIEEIFEELDPLLEQWTANPSDQETLKTIRRHFHTLKGSGRMVGARTSGEVAWTVEDLLNRLIAGAISFNSTIPQYVNAVYKIYKYKLYPTFKAVLPTTIDLRPLVLLGQNLQQELTPEPALEDLLALADTIQDEQSTTGLELASEAIVENQFEFEQVIPELQLEHSTSDDALTASHVEVIEESNVDVTAPIEQISSESIALADEQVLLNETIDIFIEESEEHLVAIDSFLTKDEIQEKDYNDLVRAIHTLRGSSTMVHLDQVFDASTKVETLFKSILEGEAELTSREMSALLEYSEFVHDYLEALKKSDNQKQAQLYEGFMASWAGYSFDEGLVKSERSQGLVSKLIDMNINQLLDAEFEFDKFAKDQNYLNALIEQTQTLIEGTEVKVAESVNVYAKELKVAYEALIEKPQLLNSDYVFELFANVHQNLIHLFDTLASGQRVSITDDIQELLQELNAFVHQDVAEEQSSDASNFTAATVDFVAVETLELEQQIAEQANDISFAESDIAFELPVTEHLEEVQDTNAIDFEFALEEPTVDEIRVDEQTTTFVNDEVQDHEMIQASEELQLEVEVADDEQFIEDALSEEIVAEAPKDLAVAEVAEVKTAVDFAALSQRIASDRNTSDEDNTYRDFDPDLIDIFLEEAEELLAEIDVSVDTWAKDLNNTKVLSNLMRYLHTLKGGANMISAKNIGLITHNLESIYERLINGHIKATPALMNIMRLVQDDVSDRIQLIRDEAIDYPATETISILQNISELSADQLAPQVSEKVETIEIEVAEQSIEEIELPAELEFESSIEPVIEALESENTVQLASYDVEEPIEFKLDVAEQPAAAVYEREIANAKSSSDDDGLQDIVEASYLEEAKELLDSMEQLLAQWSDQRSNRSILLQLQRAAHSLKGGARMLKFEPVAVITYHLENTFEQFAFHQFNSNVYDGLLSTAINWLRQAILNYNLSNYESLKASLEAIDFVDVTAQLPTSVARVDLLEVAANLEVVQGDGTEPPSMLGEWDDLGQLDNNNEMIRISADLVEKMIDLSGENSINRSRIEMELGQFVGTLNEMELAIQRLADQLRRMEGELESQIIAKHGSENSRYADFDPLEMDQYSSLNQLSKSLAESASDLVDFKTTLADKIRDAESLLLQQSRIQSEIQESLMRTRLVPFSRLLPRLQRIVRQTSSSLNRPTELVVHNTEGELDRNILERLVTPFEHMLRNAIDHGIENPQDRKALNKPETGTIELNITRQGTDVIVTFSDDGKGIDANSIREKALSLGLISKDQQLDQHEVLQLIFHPGFTTAKSVTQISGRGVGLDVVQTEIKALGGNVSLESTLGKGTTFTIRVPTTVAVSDALMVKAGDQQFALPLAQIDRIVRIAPAELEKFFASSSEYFKIDNESYKLRYISEFISNQPIPRLANVGHSLPVLLVKGSAGQTVALLVDQLVGSRSQIVVKPIGQQFAKVGAIAGATIMGDGHVCLILDSQNIARQIQATKRQEANVKQRDLNRDHESKLIMIVDDSVTVRKVTTRLLERQGYEVVTAKDGVDAVEQLENVKPDLMLLDIEMPRMDGFEVTNHVRHHELHQDLPIIMITSRTGEKHRERAFSLGVTHYMGKPFQEADLLDNIENLLRVRQG